MGDRARFEENGPHQGQAETLASLYDKKLSGEGVLAVTVSRY